MKKLTLFSFIAFFISFSAFAGDEDTLTARLEQYVKLVDSVNKAMKYETGHIKLSNNITELNVPAGFKFLNAEQSQYILTDLWGNPPDKDVLGMLWPEDGGPFADSNYAFVITYDDMGYVKDKDADDIDYEEMLKDIHTAEKDENEERTKMGYGSIHLVGWASKPYYDKTNKVLHWAKELQFDSSDDHTLNYNVRILGRKGVLVMNAVGGMSELPLVKKDIDKVLHMATFSEGNAYKDFDSNVDKVAVYTIGGLVAGKVLAKVGLFAVILKFGKFILLGIAAIGGAFFKFFKRKKPQQEELAYQAPPNDSKPIE